MSFRCKLTVFNKSKLNLSLVRETQCICINNKHLGKIPGPTTDFKVKLQNRLKYTLNSSMKLAETFFCLFFFQKYIRIFTNDVNAFGSIITGLTV